MGDAGGVIVVSPPFSPSRTTLAAFVSGTKLPPVPPAPIVTVYVPGANDNVD